MECVKIFYLVLGICWDSGPQKRETIFSIETSPLLKTFFTEFRYAAVFFLRSDAHSFSNAIYVAGNRLRVSGDLQADYYVGGLLL